MSSSYTDLLARPLWKEILAGAPKLRSDIGLAGFCKFLHLNPKMMSHRTKINWQTFASPPFCTSHTSPVVPWQELLFHNSCVECVEYWWVGRVERGCWQAMKLLTTVLLGACDDEYKWNAWACNCNDNDENGTGPPVCHLVVRVGWVSGLNTLKCPQMICP